MKASELGYKKSTMAWGAVERIMDYINDCGREYLDDGQIHEVDVDVFIEQPFTYKGFEITCTNTPRMMRAGCGLKDYTARIAGRKLQRQASEY